MSNPDKNIDEMMQAPEEQFKAQCERLWRPHGLKLQAVIDKHVTGSSPDEKLQQLRLAVAAELENACQRMNGPDIEMMMDLEEFLHRPELTWEDIERKAVRS